MSFSKNQFTEQQQHEREAASRAAEKQAEIAADLDSLISGGGASVEDLRKLQQKQSEIAEDIEILRQREKGGNEF